MDFVRNIAGLLLTLPIVYAVSSAADLQLYAAVCIAIQWVSALLYAIPKQDERFFDLTGSITFALVSLLVLVRSSSAGAGDTASLHWRNALLTAFVWCWCVRLGSFLYLRIREVGEDTRFKDIRTNPVRFFSVWSIQGLWVFLTALPVLLNVAHSTKPAGVHALDIAGISLWVIGYTLEVVADYQKTQFRRDARNKGKFIQSGLWAYSRHPNYCGEITMWVGIFLVAVHTLPSTQYQALAALGPVFVTLLLTKVSGIPLLEKQGDERWGANKAYQQYKARTSLLLLWPTKRIDERTCPQRQQQQQQHLLDMWWWGPCASASCCVDVPPLHESRAHAYDELRPLMVERASCSTPSTADSAGDAHQLLPGMYTARHRGTHELVALKVFRKRLLARQATRRRLRREVRILSMCREQPNLLTLYGVYSSRSTFEIAFELARGGEVMNRVLEQQQLSPSLPLVEQLRDSIEPPARHNLHYTFSECEVSRVIMSVVAGLRFLHAREVVHGEVRPEHVLYTDTEPDARVVLVDFGRAASWHMGELTLQCRDNSSHRHRHHSNSSSSSRRPQRFLWDDAHHCRFLPPFVRQRRSDTVTNWREAQQLDTWALGVTMYMLLCAAFPFEDSSGTNADNDMAPQPPPPYAPLQFPLGGAMISRAARDLLERLLVADPDDALSLEQVSTHPWIQDSVASSVPWSAERVEQHRAFATKYAEQVAIGSRRQRVAPSAYAYSLQDRDAVSPSSDSSKAEARDVFELPPQADDDDDDLMHERLSFVSATGDVQQAMQLTGAEDELLSADAYMRLASEEIDACTQECDDTGTNPANSAPRGAALPAQPSVDSKLWHVLTKQRRFFSFRSASSSASSLAKSDSDA